MEPDRLHTLTRRVLFAPLDETRRTETVADRLRTAITLGVLSSGEQLPNEVDLARQFNVSPVTLRDALQMLREQGLVRTTRGRQGGTFVAPLQEAGQRYLEDSLRGLSSIEIRDLTDWACAVSGHAAALAAERASDHSRRVLAEIIQTMTTTSDAAPFRRAESRLLIELAVASQSTRLSAAAVELQVHFAPIKTLAYAEPATRTLVATCLSNAVGAVEKNKGLVAQQSVVEAAAAVGDELLTLRNALVLATQGADL
ncbi:FadR/GntR family transcriptional regulator [Kocuria sp. NPDC057446]|uniref:FadR/GntR family transcriptional regulator n=1 Tax=Kocuria sp. NPDC057446 TaxID=3346137 RepID=UPI003682D38F